MIYDEIIELSQNKSINEISDIALLLEQSILHYFSRLLIDTSIEKPLKCNIRLEYFLDGNDINCTITSIYQEPSEGLVCLYIKEIEDWVNLDDFSYDMQLNVLKKLCYEIKL